MRTVAVVAALLAAPLAFAGSIPAPTVLPKPGFPMPAGSVTSSGPKLVLVSSRYRDPGALPPERPAPPAWAPIAYRGAALDGAVRQNGNVFLVYEGRYLVGADARTQGFATRSTSARSRSRRTGASSSRSRGRARSAACSTSPTAT